MEMNDLKFVLGYFAISILLTTIFSILKLAGSVEWSWTWVTSPIWIQISISVVFVVGILILSKISDKLRGR
jgi:hypothetical protein